MAKPNNCQPQSWENGFMGVQRWLKPKEPKNGEESNIEIKKKMEADMWYSDTKQRHFQMVEQWSADMHKKQRWYKDNKDDILLISMKSSQKGDE